MNQKILKWIGIGLASTMILSACSTGGSNAPAESNGEGTAGQAELSFFVSGSFNSRVVTGYGEIKGYQEIQNRTNTSIKFQSGGDASQFNIMLASGDYPDIMEVPPQYPGGVAKLVEDGVALPLNDLIEEHAPNFKKLLDEHPEVRKQVMLDDGTIAKFPQIDIDMHRIAYSGQVIRQDWLDKVGMEAPETIDEWYVVLKAFKENDMNGNGIDDEIPLGDRGDFLGTMSAFATSFGILANQMMLHPESGEVTYGPIEPGFRDYVTTMNQWYAEGLIDPEFAAVDRTAFDTKFVNNQIGAYGGMISGINSFKDTMSPEIPEFKLIGVAPAVGPTGESYSAHTQMVQNVPLGGMVVSSNSSDPVAAVKLLDFMISEEGSDLQNWGIEGESYEIVDGQKQFADLIWNDPDGFQPSEAIRRYAMPTSGQAKVMSFDAWASFELKYPEAEEANRVWYEADRALLLPPLTFTGEESQRIGRVMSEVETYQKEMWLKFIMGVEPIERFDTYVQTLKNMGIDEAIAIYQEAYNRYQERE